jgi:hypothetical protein
MTGQFLPQGYFFGRGIAKKPVLGVGFQPGPGFNGPFHP